MTPKSLLRLPACVSAVNEFTEGRWQFVIDDDRVTPERARRVILCTGKVYYDLIESREQRGMDDVAIVRVEYLYPVPADSLRQVLEAHAHVSDIVWVQEEPQNMGAWNFVQDRYAGLLQPGQRLRYVGRPRNPSPATGSSTRHTRERDRLLDEAFGDVPAEVADSVTGAPTA
jgi:2-oxoglutarate dehydrogenase E1 component